MYYGSHNHVIHFKWVFRNIKGPMYLVCEQSLSEWRLELIVVIKRIYISLRNLLSMVLFLKKLMHTPANIDRGPTVGPHGTLNILSTLARIQAKVDKILRVPWRPKVGPRSMLAGTLPIMPFALHSARYRSWPTCKMQVGQISILTYLQNTSGSDVDLDQ